MPTYRVEVLARDGSTADPLTIEAATPEAARALASGQGWIVGTACECPPPIREDRSHAVRDSDAAFEQALKPTMEMVKGLSDFAVLYGIIAIIGLITTLIGLVMSTASGSTHNLGMIHNRQVTILIGCTLFASGLLGGVGCQISAAVRSLSERLDRQSADD
jgi:hypothetical protein